jgi:carbon storage regulator
VLILGRRTGDSIVIDGGIRIVVLACERGGVRLGIEAPPDVVILRGEIVHQVAEANRRASATVDAKAWVASLLDGRRGAGAPLPGAASTSDASADAGGDAGADTGTDESGRRGTT